jgi:hypothetical protein
MDFVTLYKWTFRKNWSQTNILEIEISRLERPKPNNLLFMQKNTKLKASKLFKNVLMLEKLSESIMFQDRK